MGAGSLDVDTIRRFTLARAGSATRDEVDTMLSRLPDHGIAINFHIKVLSSSTKG